MITRSVIHDTFTIERTYMATPARVFAAFASAEARSIWGDLGGVEPADGDAATANGDATIATFDFRVGGRERFGFKYLGTTYHVDRRYHDIVPDQRIISCYEMYADGARMSVSLATIEFTKSGDDTALSWTEQGAFLDGVKTPYEAMLRRGGTTILVDNLVGYLRSTAPQ